MESCASGVEIVALECRSGVFQSGLVEHLPEPRDINSDQPCRIGIPIRFRRLLRTDAGGKGERRKEDRASHKGLRVRLSYKRAPNIPRPIFDAGIEYGILRQVMQTARKITLEVPQDLLEKAQRATGAGITQTIRTGLQLLAASQAYASLRQQRGKVRFTRTLAELKADR